FKGAEEVEKVIHNAIIQTGTGEPNRG
ncbi:MAG: hypothetical protein QG656_764, partial [Candidatus Hydrogenedentes bacterium]|nr:hypothetical protein [Candidatus Hydrogenedentota bacterium]